MAKRSQISLLIFCILIVTLAVGCSSKADTFQFQLIHDEFGLKPFEIPEDWDVVHVRQSYIIKSIDEHQGDKKAYFEEVPREVLIGFGRAAEKNEVNIKAIREDESRNNSGLRTLYSISYDEIYATLEIKRTEGIGSGVDGTASMFESFYSHLIEGEDAEVMELVLNGKNTYAFSFIDNPTMVIIWLSNDQSLMYELYLNTIETGILEADDQHEQIVSIVEKLSSVK